MSGAWQGSHSSGFPPKMRQRILRRDPVCRCLGCPDHQGASCTNPSTEADHVVPVARGGDHSMLNGAGLCSGCHGHKTKADAAEGRALKSRKRPEPRHPGFKP